MKAIFSILLLFSIVSANAQGDSCNCCSENHKAFDFWIGEWKVTQPDGTIAGQNVIKKIQGRCILQENWTGASGSTGTSTNFYNLKTKQWEQLWIDNQGNHLKLKGNRKGNQMILSSNKFTHTDSKEYINRITWTLNKDGSVRQLWEMVGQADEVKVLFDGLYKKNKM